MKLFLFLCLLFGLNANEILWTGNLVSLIEEEGLPAITLNRNAPIEDLSDEEKIELERTVGKMQTVFERVFGFGDFARWMPLENQNLTSYLIPSGAYSGPNEVDFEFKIRIMLFMLKERKELLAPLSIEQIHAIQAAAAEILPHPQPSIVLEDSNLTCSNIVNGLSYALKELNQNPILDKEPPPFNLSFMTQCKVFCNPTILQKQHINKSDFNYLLFNYKPYVDCHLMIIPSRHITTLSESTDSEILDKFDLISKINTIAKTCLGHPNVAIVTRMGWRAGQTQSHLHDHIIGFDPQADHPWIANWIQELTGNPNPADRVKLEETRAFWQTFFR